jgi:predicted Zn-dependent peptidase
MDLLLTLLADGQDALLPDQWRANGVVVKQFGIEYVGSRAPGRFMIWMDTAPEAAQAARDATIAYMKQLAADPVAPEVWRNAQQRLAARFLRENETYTQQASTLAFYEGLGDARLAGEYLPAVERMTPEQFRTFVPTHCLAWITLGKEPK